MIRLPLATVSALLVALAAGAPALGQTVADYRDAIRTAPILEVPQPTAEAHCRPLENFVAVSMPEWTLKMPWLLGIFPIEGAPDPDVAAKREACLQYRQQAVIQFDDGSGQEIVTPPGMEDPERAYNNPDPRPLPPL